MPDEIDIEFDDPEEEDAGQFGLEQIEQEDAEEERQAELSRRRAEHDLKRQQQAQERRRQRLTREGRPPENLGDLSLPLDAPEEQAGDQAGESVAETLGQIKDLLERGVEILEEIKESRQAGVFGP